MVNPTAFIIIPECCIWYDPLMLYDRQSGFTLEDALSYANEVTREAHAFVLDIWKEAEPHWRHKRRGGRWLRRRCSSDSPERILAKAGVDIRSAGFWQCGFDVVRGLVERLEAAPANRTRDCPAGLWSALGCSAHMARVLCRTAEVAERNCVQKHIAGAAVRL